MTAAMGTEVQGGVTENEKNIFKLPYGLFGFPELKEMEVVFDEEELPFMWLREENPEGMAFVVIEPNGLIPDYVIEIPDADVEALQMDSSDSPLILNIVTIGNQNSSDITVNLVGPVVINKRLGLGKQVIINNHEKYSAKYVLFNPSEEEGNEAAAC